MQVGTAAFAAATADGSIEARITDEMRTMPFCSPPCSYLELGAGLINAAESLSLRPDRADLFV
ncbi:hypothetical protein ACIGW8_31405 [Streptomyces sioyaensis]|uniref:hypothetical protein n=1 Tax=Streptomyces sioyaensis TaxID=67364 RepID=UPI0037D023B7